MPQKTKDLYMTKNFTLEELNKMIDAKTEPSLNPKLILNTADKLFLEAKKAELDGDEERAYVLYMRYFDCVKKIQKSEEYKKETAYYNKMLGNQRISETFSKCKTLSDSLKDRYVIMRQANKLDSDLKVKEVTEALNNEKCREGMKDSKKTTGRVKNVISGSNGVIKPIIEDDEEKKNKILQESGVITAKYLKNLVEQQSTRILAIDCRSKHDFNRARLIHSNCISIPSEILQPGMTANQVEKKLKELHPESYMDWIKRAKFDQIILYDWNSSLETQQPPIDSLYRSMTQWDPETVYRSPPAVLQGGIRNLYYNYPFMIMQPQNISEDAKKVENLTPSTVISLDSITYPSLDDEEVNNKSKSSSPSPKISNDLSSNGLNFKNSTNNNSFDNYKPSESVIVDRSTKPKSSITSFSNHQDTALPSGLVNGIGLSKTPNVDQTELKREAVNAALDDIIRSTKEVSKNEEMLSELRGKESSSVDEATALQLKNMENELTLLKKQIENKDENFSILEREYKALVEKDNSKSTLPPIRLSDAEARIQEKMNTRRDLDSYVNKIREDRKNKEKLAAEARAMKLPVINSPKIAPQRNSTSTSTAFPAINSVSEGQKGVLPTSSNQVGAKPSYSSGGLLRPMSQDASPLTNLQKLKDGSSSDSPRSSLLKRSHSHPNITQSVNEEVVASDQATSQTPNFNRNQKPSATRPYVPETFTPTRTREFHAVNSTERHKTGLKNLGNTCYMNSIMQCINHLTSLVEYLMNETFKSHLKKDRIPTKGDITLEVSAAIKEMNYGHRSIALNDFKSVVGRYHPSFRGYEQQDSHEFLTILLDCLHEELNRVAIKTPLKEQKNDDLSDGEASQIAWNDYCASNLSKISELFCGQQKSCVKCQGCGKKSVTFEPFFILSVPIPSTNRKVDVQQCIELYTSEEEVAGWNCVYCKCKGKATKKIDLWKLPPYLIIHLQRFYNDGWWKKRLTEVDFPVDNLDLTSKVMGRPSHVQDIRIPRLNFQLNGVSNHYGTMDGGHYTAYCRKQGVQWCKFDDHEVNPISPRDVCTPAAYILFYCNISP